MTFSATQSRYTYSGNGTTKIFGFPRFVFVAEDLDVALVDNATSAVTPQVLDTHYTVTSLKSALANVNFVTAPPSGKTVVVDQTTQVVQPVDLGGVTQLPMQALEDQLDRAMMLIDEMQQALVRAGLLD